jgi:hypothetical protein
VTRTKTSAILLVAAGLIGAACSGGSDGAVTVTTQSSLLTSSSTTSSTTVLTTTTTVPTSTIPVVTTTTIPDRLRMPLTGQPLASISEIPNRPALAVKIPVNGRPHAALNEADIVFEQIINDNFTRFAAVFHSTDAEVVGPIRSGRSQDVNLLEAFDEPLFAWSGGNPGVTQLIRNSALNDLSAVFTSGYYRRSGRSNPNDLYSSTDALWAQTPEDFNVPPVVFPYLRNGEALTGDPAENIEVTLDDIDVRWEYDDDSGRYFRWQNGSQHDTEAHGQVWADNLVVMFTNYSSSSIDGNPEAQTLGSNPVFVFSGGTVRTGVWLRFLPEDGFAFFDNIDDLNPIGLVPGRTWAELPRNRDDVLVWS